MCVLEIGINVSTYRLNDEAGRWYIHSYYAQMIKKNPGPTFH